MPYFKYKGLHSGKKVKGVIENESASNAQKVLREDGIMIIDLQETSSPSKKVGIQPRTNIERKFSGIMISNNEIAETIRQLVIMFKGDIAVVAAFNIAKGLAKGMLAQALHEVAERVKNGSSLSDAMKKDMSFIGELQLSLITVGEANGSLPEMFEYSLELMDQARTIRNKIMQAMIYPAIVTVVGGCVGYYVSAVTIPKIAGVLGGNIDRLPKITRYMLNTSEWITNYGYLIVITPIILTFLFIYLKKIKRTGVILDFIMLKIPVFGKVFSFSANTLWNRTFAILLESGVNVLESIELTKNTMFNRYYRRQFELVSHMVINGKSLSESISKTGLKKFSPMSASLIEVGENSGNIVDGIKYVGDYYNDALERKLDLLSKLVEPALIICVGGMVGFVYTAFFMGMAAANQPG